MVKFSFKGSNRNAQFHTVYDNAGAGAGAAGTSGSEAGGAGGGTGDGSANGAGSVRTYTEAEHQTAIKAERARLEQASRKTVQEYQRLQASSATSEEEKTRLATRIKELEEEFMTKDELAKRAREKAEGELTQKYNQASEDAKNWRNRFEKQLKETAVVTAASKAGAKRPEMFMNLLGDNIVANEIIDETGKGTGQFEVKVKYNKSENGEVKELVLKPEDAFKFMKEDTTQFGFLFDGDKSPGIGGNSGKPDAPVDLKNLTPENYRALRKAGKLGF